MAVWSTTFLVITTTCWSTSCLTTFLSTTMPAISCEQAPNTRHTLSANFPNLSWTDQPTDHWRACSCCQRHLRVQKNHLFFPNQVLELLQGEIEEQEEKLNQLEAREEEERAERAGESKGRGGVPGRVGQPEPGLQERLPGSTCQLPPDPGTCTTASLQRSVFLSIIVYAGQWLTHSLTYLEFEWFDPWWWILNPAEYAEYAKYAE